MKGFYELWFNYRTLFQFITDSDMDHTHLEDR